MALNSLKFKNVGYWNTFLLIIYMMIYSKFTGYDVMFLFFFYFIDTDQFRVSGFLKTYGGFFFIILLILIIKYVYN